MNVTIPVSLMVQTTHKYYCMTTQCFKLVRTFTAEPNPQKLIPLVNLQFQYPFQYKEFTQNNFLQTLTKLHQS